MTYIVTPLLSNPKNLKETFSLLRSIKKSQSVVIRKAGIPLDRKIAQLSKSDTGGFLLKYEDPFSPPIHRKDLEDFTLEGSHNIHIIAIANSNSLNTTIEDHIEEFNQIGFDEVLPAFHRLVFPIKESLNFTFCIQQVGFQTENHRSAQCIRAEFEDIFLDLYVYKDQQDQHFLLLDSASTVAFTVFSARCFSALVVLGYISARLIQNEAFYFSYDNQEMDVPVFFGLKRYRKSISSIYIPLYSNAGGYISDHDQIEKINHGLRPLSSQEFSHLCKWASRSFEFTAILLLIIEATKSSLAIMPAAYAVALESITDLIVSDNEEAFAPLKNKTLATEIRIKLKSTLKEFEDRLDTTALNIFKARLDNINQLTNNSKLTKPFEYLKFTLSKADIDAIDHRNDFLHGRITYLSVKSGERKHMTHEASSQEIYYTALRLYTLLAVLILKSVGYDNKIVNHPKIQRHNYTDPDVLELLEKEEYFRQI